MGLIGSIIIGFLVGIIFKLLMPHHKNGLFKVTEILGVLGAVAAFELGSLLGWYRQDHPVSFVASLFGALLVLVCYRWIVQRRATPRRP